MIWLVTILTFCYKLYERNNINNETQKCFKLFKPEGAWNVFHNKKVS